MKTKNNFDRLNERLDFIERILQLLVVNSLVDDINNTCGDEFDETGTTILARVYELLEEYNMVAVKSEEQAGFTLVYIKTSTMMKYKAKDFRVLDCEIKGLFAKVIPVFMFEAINGMLRKRLIEDNISFCVNEKEMHICAKIV